MKIKKIVAITALMFTPILSQASGVFINPNPQGGSFYDVNKEDAVIIGGQGSKTSTAIGVGTGVSEIGVGVGFQAQADAGAITVGANSNATKTNTVIGTGSIADNARDTIVIGHNSTANSQTINSIILGNNITVTRSDELILGGKTIGGVLDAEFDDQAVNLGQLNSAIAGLGGGGTGGTDPNAIVYDSSTGSTATLKGVDGTELRNVSAGTLDNSGANVGQVKQAITTSNNYTDVKTAETLVQANQYTDNKAVETLTKANQYTDEQVKDKVAYDNDAGSAVTFKGQEGTELRNVRAGTTGTSAVNLQQLHQAQQGLQRYADEGDMRTLQQANQYTDNRFNELNKKLNGVSAMSSAQSNIIYNPYGSQYQLGLGVGASGGESAVSMKFMGATNDKRVIYSFGVSKATSGKATYGAGVTWGF